MDVIVIDSRAFQALVDEVSSRLITDVKECVEMNTSESNAKEWLTAKEVMNLKGIRSHTTLITYRVKFAWHYTSYEHKILCSKKSIEDSLEKNPSYNQRRCKYWRKPLNTRLNGNQQYHDYQDLGKFSCKRLAENERNKFLSEDLSPHINSINYEAHR
jgi:hypothetical protein